MTPIDARAGALLRFKAIGAMWQDGRLSVAVSRHRGKRRNIRGNARLTKAPELPKGLVDGLRRM
ncbi:hypothetical protein HMPREF0043_02160 [Actinobaculum sp. oral taxon 183 str. F0552]|nr:hypothetical protein HMPREF0043_02160 [Actinobaculum sp. oral taxon 183 str. F0552]